MQTKNETTLRVQSRQNTFTKLQELAFGGNSGNSGNADFYGLVMLGVVICGALVPWTVQGLVAIAGVVMG